MSKPRLLAFLVVATLTAWALAVAIRDHGLAGLAATLGMALLGVGVVELLERRP